MWDKNWINKPWDYLKLPIPPKTEI
jgi:hypothetical protein